jgi:hypothetical protein
MVAIVKKQLKIEKSLNDILQIVRSSVNIRRTRIFLHFLRDTRAPSC